MVRNIDAMMVAVVKEALTQKQHISDNLSVTNPTQNVLGLNSK
jgi:hypothetical protein